MEIIHIIPYLTLLKILLLSIVISCFEPLEMVLTSYFPGKMFVSLFLSIQSCLNCVSFWTGLILTHNIWIASASFLIGGTVSFINEIRVTIINKWRNKEILKNLDK